ncbi:MAG: alanine racemase [Polyangiaceae bacterium]|nr:alanine racemase [Polyangiaceae bacterium]
MLDYRQLREALSGERLPAAFVDLDAFDRNLTRVLAALRGRDTPLRPATKSLRVAHLLRRLVDRGEGLVRGMLCYSCEEAEHLASRGFDDLLVAYPPFQRADLARVARLTAEGLEVSVTADSREGAERISEVGVAHGVRVRVVLCVDMSLRLLSGRVHLGVRRSPLHSPEQVVRLARHVEALPGCTFHGLMGYEAQVAGLGDDNPFDPRLNAVKAMVKRASALELARRRRAMVEALHAEGLPPTVVNGGGSGSLDTTTRASGVTEVTAGSAFFKPHLFDYYRAPHMRALEPSAFFALEVTRRPATELVTCLGGGYVASGPPGADKVPRPWLPAGVSLLPAEMCGEVQTPLSVPRGVRLELGDPVIFRHAKAGELAERFREVLLLADGQVVDRVPTYRGEGQCFL